MKRCGLRGELGNAMYAVLAGAGFNLMKLMRALAHFAPSIFTLLNAPQMEIQRIGAVAGNKPSRNGALLAI